MLLETPWQVDMPNPVTTFQNKTCRTDVESDLTTSSSQKI
jgi:hypothetical protein